MERSSVCVVCYKPTTLFNYGVTSCNACKMFFRRATCWKHPRICQYNKLCYSNPPVIWECKYCRYAQCLRVGMRNPDPIVPEFQLATKNYGLSKLISQLSTQDASRENNLLTCHFPDNLTISELFTGPLVTFQPKVVSYDAMDWGFMEQITIIDYIRKFDFVKNFTSSDYEIFMKESYFKWSSLTIAMRNFLEKREVVRFHGEFDIFPEEIVRFGGFPEDMFVRIRSQVIAKLIQLDIKKPEFLLISMVLFCNPGIPDLSQNGIKILSTQRQKYSNALISYCFNTYQGSAPSRLVDLLSLHDVINKNFEDVSHYFFLLKMCFPPAPMKKLYLDLFNYRF